MGAEVINMMSAMSPNPFQCKHAARWTAAAFGVTAVVGYVTAWTPVGEVLKALAGHGAGLMADTSIRAAIATLFAVAAVLIFFLTGRRVHHLQPVFDAAIASEWRSCSRRA